MAIQGKVVMGVVSVTRLAPKTSGGRVVYANTNAPTIYSTPQRTQNASNAFLQEEPTKQKTFVGSKTTYASQVISGGKVTSENRILGTTAGGRKIVQRTSWLF
jgi:hypothetical protein